MKILYIIHDNKKGGAAISFLDMIKGVSEKHEVYVLTPHKKGYIPDELDKLGIWHESVHYFWWEIVKSGNPFIDAIRFGIYKLLNLYNCISAKHVAQWAKRNDIDIIHSNSSVVYIGALASEYTSIPHVWHLRELGNPDFSLSPVFRNGSLEQVINIGNSFYIAISDYVATFYKKYIHGKTIYTVYNGINSSYNYKKSKKEYNTDTIYFLISGNYCEEKGQLDVAHTIGLLVSQGVKEFKVYMAGRGDYTEVKKYLADNKLTEYVVFCGLVEDIISLRKKCDVEIVASRAEAFGRVTVEAMRTSNPVIGSSVGGTAEIVLNGKTGFLYEYRNNEALADCMKKFIVEADLAYEMGQRAYEWSVDRFTSEENVRQVLKIYEDVVKHSLSEEKL